MKNAPLRHALEYAAAAPLLALVRALPHGASRRLGAALGALAHAADRRHRAIARANLAAAFPELAASERAHIARRSFVEIGRSFLDAVSASRFGAVELCRRFDSSGLERVAEAERAGRGVIFLTAHYGAWEVAPLWMAHASGPISIVGRPLDNPHLERAVAAGRNRLGNRLLPKRGSVREMFRVLREGGRLGLLIDQRVRPDEAIDVPFFGRPALTSPIVGRLALKTGAPVVPVFAELAPGGRYRAEVHEPMVAPEGGGEEAGDELTRRALAVCEAAIRRAPERWLWQHDRWRH